MEANQLSAKDLRLGNNLQDEIGNIYTVRRLNTEDDDDILVNEKMNLKTLNYDVFGIPLSEDVLLKLGFEKYSAENFKHQKVDKLRAYLQPIRNGYGIYLEGCYSLPNIKSVHQLQNLYYALTGEELTFKN